MVIKRLAPTGVCMPADPSPLTHPHNLAINPTNQVTEIARIACGIQRSSSCRMLSRAPTQVGSTPRKGIF
ncbi:MAG: hypothetical protein MUO76_12205 [Anaerolineaceae bacterium]|nr:hypothetical protein [Anaerolineaceae bacterium]